MNVKLYISNEEISFDFEDVKQRDCFFENMGSNPSLGFTPQDAAKKVGDRTIRIYPERFQIAYMWSIVFPE